ncbi:hypothetical protein GCM10012286_81830 [Streptomyces lasiicapitis]|uniref:Uncharacterized protein n=1 Tax=Streptomyces lasiicapitis TaxID=1923961 RepID=A0ABQ2MXF1_9ACTN|nr:hypothetical protein GCM10012286_81830 [Streptomyces lasiicapitis]
MDGDDGLESAGAVLAEHDLLVAPLIRVEEGVQDAVGYIGHGGDSRLRSGGWAGARAGGGPPFAMRVEPESRA